MRPGHFPSTNQNAVRAPKKSETTLIAKVTSDKPEFIYSTY